MRGQQFAWVVVALLVGLAAPASAKRAACAPPIAQPAPHQSIDREPPLAPALERAVLYPDGISIGATFSTDTVAVQLLYKDTTGATVELWTTPSRTYVCGPLARHLTEISVTAIDEAGNTSTTLGRIQDSVYDGRRHHCGLGRTMFAFVMLSVIGLFFLGLIALFCGGYRRARMRLGGEPITPLVAEAITRATIDAKLVTITIGFVLAMLLYFTDDAFYSFLVAYVPASRVLHLVRVRRFLALLDGLELPATLHDNLLAVHARYIVVPRSIVRDAKRRAVPAAIQR